MPLFSAIFYASSGNILAIVFNYFLGYYLYEKSKFKLKKSSVGRKSLYFASRYRYFILPFTWVPIFGDPLTIVAGIVRLNFLWFFLVAGFLRISRYYVLSLI